MESLKHEASPSFPAESESLNASFTSGKQESPTNQIQILKKRFRRTKDEINNYLMIEQKFKNANFAHLNFHNYNQKIVQDVESQDLKGPVNPLIKSQSNEASIKSIESLSTYEKEIILQEFCEVQPEDESANKLADLQPPTNEAPAQQSNEGRIYFVHNKFQDDFDDDNFDDDEFIVDMNGDSENNFDEEEDANQCQSNYLDNSPSNSANTNSISTENSDDNMQSFDDKRQPPHLKPSIIHEAASFSIRL